MVRIEHVCLHISLVSLLPSFHQSPLPHRRCTMRVSEAIITNIYSPWWMVNSMHASGT